MTEQVVLTETVLILIIVISTLAGMMTGAVLVLTFLSSGVGDSKRGVAGDPKHGGVGGFTVENNEGGPF